MSSRQSRILPAWLLTRRCRTSAVLAAMHSASLEEQQPAEMPHSLMRLNGVFLDHADMGCCRGRCKQ